MITPESLNINYTFSQRAEKQNKKGKSYGTLNIYIFTYPNMCDEQAVHLFLHCLTNSAKRSEKKRGNARYWNCSPV